MQLRQCDDGVAVLLITTRSLTLQEQETLKATAQSLELASLYVGINTQDGNSLYCDEVTLIHGASTTEQETYRGQRFLDAGPLNLCASQ